MFETITCTETVSILEAVVFGVDGACIDIGLASLLGAVVAFIFCVVGLRVLGSRLLKRLFPSRRPDEPAPVAKQDAQFDDGLQRMPYESPIKSTGAWGGKAR